MKKLYQPFRFELFVNGLVIVTLLFITSGFAQEEGPGPGYVGLDRARAVTGDKVKCPQCGTLNDPTNPNCVSCGYGLKPGSSPGTTAAPSPPPTAIPADEYRRFEAAAPPVAPEGGVPGVPAPPKEEKKYTVKEGTHEWCVKCGKELRKPKKREIVESQISGYFDDGTHGDEVTGDGIYSNVTEQRDRLCDQCWAQFQSLKRLIDYAQRDSAVEFYMVYAASEDPVTNPPSPIPTYGYWASRRDGSDGFISDYTARIFAPFKDSITKEFYQQFQFSAEELAEIAAEKKRQQMERLRAQGMVPGQYQGSMVPPAMYGEGQPEQYRSSYFGERQSGPEGAIGP
ncbi:MAG: zinc ribbon domain-containing protein [bacterium]|nr:zinc ribbon domain-containing protein [bacterium]